MIALNYGALGKYCFPNIDSNIKTFEEIYRYKFLFKYLYNSDACCCTNWFGYNNCGCNLFGCNCMYAQDDLCYYSSVKYSAIIPLISGYCELPTCRTPERCSAVTLNDGVCQ